MKVILDAQRVEKTDDGFLTFLAQLILVEFIDYPGDQYKIIMELDGKRYAFSRFELLRLAQSLKEF